MRPKRKIRAQVGKKIDTSVPTSSTVATIPPDEVLPSQYQYGNVGDMHIPELPNPQQWHGPDTVGGDEFNQGILPQDNLSTTETTTQAPKGNAYESIFRGLRGSSILGSFLASKKRNTLLRQYEYKQQSALGQMNPMPVSQFQYSQNDYTTPNRMYAQEGGMMNPYSYYAKNGGNLPQIIKDYNKWSNDAKEMDMTSGYGPEGKPQHAKGGFAFDEAKVRDIITRLMQVGSGPHPYRKKKGGKITPNDARQILHDGTAQGHPLTDKQRRYFGALSKGNTLHFPQKEEGGNIKHIDMELRKGGNPAKRQVRAQHQQQGQGQQQQIMQLVQAYAQTAGKDPRQIMQALQQMQPQQQQQAIQQMAQAVQQSQGQQQQQPQGPQQMQGDQGMMKKGGWLRGNAGKRK